MKKLIIYIGLLLITQVTFSQCPLNRLVNEINTNTQLKNAIKNNPDLIDSWKKLDDLGADDVIKNNPDALKYLSNGRSNEILLEVEELLGGHSMERHGAHLSLLEMEQRVMNTHPTMPQSRSALKFDTNQIHIDAVNRAFNHHKTTIESHFQSSNDYLQLDYNFGSRIGEGYTNIGTRNNPISSLVNSNIVRLAFRADSNSPGGYILDSSYPLFN
ncbi:hypothetical protein [Aquimarina rubra]|uniref:Bacterial CdiA-CT RNAse A domain-containing protein n=1 Tax=Aquimarina rubra TaxID=1920033 RepID=A0ABW5LH26_9FLAO